MRKTLLALAILGCLPAFALKTAYVSFDHPDGWRCELSQGVWICQSTLEGERRESVVLSIATMATEWDTVDNYLEYLKKPRTITDDQGKPVESKVTYARKRDINGITWIDSLQVNSELPGFWSRYVATVHNKLAILITYVVSQEHYQKLAPQFERMVASLKPNAEFDLNIATKQGDVPLPGNSKLGPLQANILKDRLKPAAPAAEEAPEEPGSSTPLMLGLLVVVGAAYYFVRKRRKKQQPPSSHDRAA
ncbi:LPXTG cell wall anchor domain-containing protein [bacterium]|nr:LPXTG cell wall anchor domain-containing protein [bacterium]